MRRYYPTCPYGHSREWSDSLKRYICRVCRCAAVKRHKEKARQAGAAIDHKKSEKSIDRIIQLD